MIVRLLMLGLLLGAMATNGLAGQQPVVHAVVDLSHEFTFYGDGRFGRQYLRDQKHVTNWGTLFKFDFSNANLVVLLGCAQQLTYWPQDIAAINAFLQDGGGLVVFVASGRGPQADLAGTFGAAGEEGAAKPLAAAPELKAEKIEGSAGIRLKLSQPDLWTVLMSDAKKAPVVVMRKVGKGRLLVLPRSLAGSRPDASDPINAAWLSPLLVRVASGKSVDASKPFMGRGLTPGDYVEKHEGLKLHYTDYLKPYAGSMFAIAQRCKPVIEKRMGVPLSPGMASEIGLLATDGGGFSSGQVLGLAVWWGGFPDRQDSMIEFITHESVHSWVLPFGEIWNEPIATYVGNLVMMDMGHAEEANRRIQATIRRAVRYDREMKLYDMQGNSIADAPKLEGEARTDLQWGKAFWIFEQLRKEKPDFLARYFQAKRRLALPGKIKEYDENNTVAVLSVAMGRDLFPWFREHGFDVDHEKAVFRGQIPK
jgi:hypothetical protein